MPGIWTVVWTIGFGMTQTGNLTKTGTGALLTKVGVKCIEILLEESQ